MLISPKNGKAHQLSKSLKKALSQLWPKRFLGIFTAAIILVVVILTTASISVAALSKSVQTATFIDNMAYNITKNFTIQQHVNKIVAKLQAIKAAIKYLKENTTNTIAYR